MKKILTLVLAAAAFCTLSTPVYSASAITAAQALASPHGKCVQELIGMFDNMTSVLKTVNSTSSANAAAARLLPYASQTKNLMSRVQSLGSPSKELDSKLEELLSSKLENSMGGFSQEMQRLQQAEFYGSTALMQALMTIFGNNN